MWQSEELKSHLETSTTVTMNSKVVAEWNMNDPDNFAAIGNYRYRPADSTSAYKSLISVWDTTDVGQWYTGATDNDIEVFGPYDDSDEPVIFEETDEKIKRLYSLDDCLKPHRPRSGINYLRVMRASGIKYTNGIGKNVTSQVNNSSVNRPRYYLSDPANSFKYWSSWRKDGANERGISYSNQGLYFIDDCVPFVVYKDIVPTNKLVVKMQTNIGTENLGEITTPAGRIDDPLYGWSHATTPKNWNVEVLKDGVWTSVYSFQEGSTRSDDSPIVKQDGYVELLYGIKIPVEYGEARYIKTVPNESLIPSQATQGDYYLLVDEEDIKGNVYIWNNGDWVILTDPEYGWYLGEDESRRQCVTDLTDPESWVENSRTFYREFDYIQGIRIVVRTMNRDDVPFELIEMSPRLVVDVTDKTVSFDVNKSMGQIEQTALPVGGLEAGTGNIELFDNDFAFSSENENSIVANYIDNNIAFTFYDVIVDGDFTYTLPIKTLHTEAKAPTTSDICTVKFALRDSFYIFENEPAPAIMVKNVSLSYAIACLLDSIGFSNYVFLNKDGATEPIIPFFFVAPDQNVAEVLQKLSVATQSAMYFDEYNNFVVAFREYVYDKDRTEDITLDGDSSNPNGSAQPNIADIASDEKRVYNGGTINYTERYIQRSIGSLTQANFVNADQNWIYLPALLWEVSGDESTRTVNQKASTQSSYALAALPLRSDLSDDLPTVTNGPGGGRRIVNNVIDVGDNVYWLPRYKGYLYSGAEIIKYDAVRYIVQGQPAPVWISSNDEYQKYFSQLPFNGKMFPDGFIRIYAEPYYEYIDGVEYLKRGAVAKHGRGQFKTGVTNHSAGVPSEWLSDSRVRGIKQSSEYLFTSAEPPATIVGTTTNQSQYNTKAQTSRRTGLIRNFMRDKTYTDAQVIESTTDRSGLIQASALTLAGPSRFTSEDSIVGDIPRDFVTYAYKPLSGTAKDKAGTPLPGNYRHFGTRMRIIGKIESASDVDQTPTGSTSYYNFLDGGEAKILNGGSAGLGIGVNSTNNSGYYLELVALTNTNIEDISDDGVGGHTIVFWKNVIPASGDQSKAVPIKLWGGLAEIIVDSGTFTGAQRTVEDEKSTVYDISVEYQDFATYRRFYIFLNGGQIATVDDTLPIPVYDSMAVFVRGSSQAMFEHVFALQQSVSKNSTTPIIESSQIDKAFGNGSVTAANWDRYGISGMVKKTFLSGVSSSGPPEYSMYYEEFGSLMRECAYFDIKYDKAYPAITSQISPSLNDTPGYRVSGYRAGSYGAQFLVFNIMDKAITLDETSGNYLRIQGVTFTQDTTHELTMDKFYDEASNMSDPDITDSGSVLKSPRSAADTFKTLKISRMKYGKTEWSFDNDYIQSQGAANNLMEWLADKTVRPRKLVGIEVFPNTMIQLGDIINFSYSVDGYDKISGEDKKFVVYSIDYNRDSSGPTMNLYVSEV